MIWAKPLQIIFDKIDGFIRISDGTRYLKLIGSEKYDTIYYLLIRYLGSLKSNITYIFSYLLAKTKVPSFIPLRLEKVLTLHNV